MATPWSSRDRVPPRRLEALLGDPMGSIDYDAITRLIDGDPGYLDRLSWPAP